MSTNILVRFRAPPGQEAALADAARSFIEARAEWMGRGQRGVRLFEARDEPGHLLLFAEWESRETYFARLQEQTDMQAAIRTLCAEPPQRRFFARRAIFESMGEPIAVLACTVLQAPPGMVAPLDRLVGVWRTLPRDAPGLVQYALYQDEDQPDRFLATYGWRSAGVRAGYLVSGSPNLRALMTDQGFSGESFVGVTRVERGPLTSGSKDALSPLTQPASTSPSLSSAGRAAPTRRSPGLR